MTKDSATLIREVLEFWFGEHGHPQRGGLRDVWFEKNADFDAEINRRFAEDRPALAKYNLKDCELVTRIFDKTHSYHWFYAGAIPAILLTIVLIVSLGRYPDFSAGKAR